MSDLLDVNVWVALSASAHRHHAIAKKYWERRADTNLVLCRVISLSMLRLLTNRHVMKSAPLTTPQAWATLEQWLREPNVAFVSEPATLDAVFATSVSSLRLKDGDWTDAYLAAFASAGGYRLVTFDAGFKRFPALDLLYLDPDLPESTTLDAET